MAAGCHRSVDGSSFPHPWSRLPLGLFRILLSVFRRPLRVTVRHMLRDRCHVCPVCLSVTSVYCCQTVGLIKMLFGTEVALGPGDIVLDENPAAHGKGHSSPPLFSPLCSGTVAHLSNCWALVLYCHEHSVWWLILIVICWDVSSPDFEDSGLFNVCLFQGFKNFWSDKYGLVFIFIGPYARFCMYIVVHVRSKLVALQVIWACKVFAIPRAC